MARVFVVDDDAGIRSIIASCCELDGHAAQTFGTTAEALAAYAAGPPDLLILDKHMDGGGATHFLAEVERRHGRVACPVLVVTGDPTEAVGSVAIDAVIAKPFNIDALRHAVNSAIRG